MMNSDSNLLHHPVVLALLDVKLWQFGWPLYYLNLLIYILQLSLLTAFILLLPNPQDPQCQWMLVNVVFCVCNTCACVGVELGRLENSTGNATFEKECLGECAWITDSMGSAY